MCSQQLLPCRKCCCHKIQDVKPRRSFRKFTYNECEDTQVTTNAIWKETRRLMEESEQLVRLITHVCSYKATGIFRTLARYSKGCWSGGCRPIGRECKECDQRGPCSGGLPAANPGSTAEYLCSEDVSGRGDPLKRTCSRFPPIGASLPVWSHSEAIPTGFRSPCIPEGRACPEVSDRCVSPDSPRGGSKNASDQWHWASRAKSKYRSAWRPSLLTILIFLVATLARITESCSSRSTPKPRPQSPTLRPNVTFLTYACPPTYAAWFCLNGATCFTVRIQDAILYNCECAEGYMGPRCEFKDLDGSYLAREKTASLAGGAALACVFVFIVLLAVYVFLQKDYAREKERTCPYSDEKAMLEDLDHGPKLIRSVSTSLISSIGALRNPSFISTELPKVEVLHKFLIPGASPMYMNPSVHLCSVHGCRGTSCCAKPEPSAEAQSRGDGLSFPTT